MTAIVGTSGWQYDDWRGILYPEGLPKSRWLEHFSSQIPAVEVNNTFYRLPKEETFASWRDRTPDGFVFAVKASRFITHIRRLRDVSEAVTTLIERASALGPKLGPVLYQTPPSLAREDALLTDFLATVPPYPRATMEFRHPSWFCEEVYEALQTRDVALCVTGADHCRATASWAYLRLHGGPDYSQYTEEESEAWAARASELHSGGAEDVFIFFDNDAKGAAVLDAGIMAGRLEKLGVPVRGPT